MNDDLRPIPMAIDRPRMYCPEGQRGYPDHGYSGGLEWDPAFDRYMRHVLPLSVLEARRRRREWWKNACLLEQVCHALAETHGERQARSYLECVLLLYQEPRPSYRQVARAQQQSLDWLIARKCEVLRLVRLLNQ